MLDRFAKNLPSSKIVYRDLQNYYKKKFTIDYSRDVSLVFFCGIGDMLYGLPFLFSARQKCDESGVKLYAYCCVSKTGTASNSAINEFLNSLNLFDDVFTIPGYETEYWKYYDWRLAERHCSNNNIYPFIYSTERRLRSRFQGINYSFPDATVEPKFDDLKELFEFSNATLGSQFDVLDSLRTWSSNKKKIVFCHLESRSGRYQYPYTVQLVNCLTGCGYNVVLVSDKFSEIKSRDQVFCFTEKDIPLFHVMCFIKLYVNLIIATNSVFWPVGQIFDKYLVGVHFLRGDDGHHFSYDSMDLLTSSKYSHKKCIKKGHMSHLLVRNQYQENDNENYVDIYPGLICSFAKMRLG